MPGRKVQRPNILAIQVHGNVMVESDNGQRLLGLRLGVFYTVAV